jgi:hypothetical protein
MHVTLKYVLCPVLYKKRKIERKNEKEKGKKKRRK